jgi:hypothetical protein
LGFPSSLIKRKNVTTNGKPYTLIAANHYFSFLSIEVKDFSED